jgi:hypothetical protein
MNRVQGERERIGSKIENLRAHLDALETALNYEGPGPQNAESITQSACDLAMCISRLWAYVNVEGDS